jgi:hypothetical protein
MDPYLETQPRWEIFHGWFIRELARLTLPRAASMGCWIDVERDVYGEDPSGEMVLVGEPDEVFSVSAREAEWAGNGTETATLTTPRSVREVAVDPADANRHRQQYLVVRENQDWPRALAVVELLSPANKTGNYAPTTLSRLAALALFRLRRTEARQRPKRRSVSDPVAGFVADHRPATLGRASRFAVGFGRGLSLGV